jgi:SAM-dependent methyltransferase
MTSEADAGVYAYDRVPFGSTSVPRADCRHLEMIARLFGVAVVPPAHARVLELGCGSGANLVPSALERPLARFIGCDLSESALASGRRTVERMGLTNVELRHADLRDVDDGWGNFDYIVCHDVFSWVDPGVRRKILAILRRNLTPRGVGYVSYDALPGWHLHGIARDLMRYHAAAFADSRQAVDQARAILGMAAAVQDQQHGPYAALWREEYFILSTMQDDQLYHLAFSEHHEAFYFHEFDDLLGQAGLQFIADADAAAILDPRQPPPLRALLDELPRVNRRQYLDFLNNCTFRCALVCHRDVPLRNAPDEGVLRDSWIGLSTNHRQNIAAPNSLIGEALARLDEKRPEFVSFGVLADKEALRPGFFLEAYAAGMLDLALSPPSLSSRIGEQPVASALVRLQVQESATVTNQKCEPVRLTDLARHVVTLLDGAHTRDDVIQSVAREIRRGTLASDWIGRMKGVEPDAERLTDDSLRYLRDHALLVA